MCIYGRKRAVRGPGGGPIKPEGRGSPKPEATNRPNPKDQGVHKQIITIFELRAKLKMGDKIITIGGIHGKIIELGNSSVVIEVHGGTKIKVLKSAVSMSGEVNIDTKK